MMLTCGNDPTILIHNTVIFVGVCTLFGLDPSIASVAARGARRKPAMPIFNPILASFVHQGTGGLYLDIDFLREAAI